MHRIASSFLRLFGLLAATFLSWPALAGWQITTIDYPGADFIQVFGISNNGQVVGTAYTGDVRTPFVYDVKKATFTTLLPLPGSTGIAATGITESGTIVGSAFDALGTESGYILDKKGRFTTFANPGWDNTEVRGVNNTGLVTGYSYDDAFINFVGFIYDSKGNTFTEILPHDDVTIAQGVNNKGQVVGSFSTPDTEYGWLRGTDGTLTRFLVNDNPAAARGITDSGVIAGFTFDLASGLIKGFITTTSALAGVADLGSIAIPDGQLFEVPGAFNTFIQGISNSGAICGYFDDGVTLHGFVATPSK